MMSIRRRQEEMFIPLIRSRRGVAAVVVECYADSLLGSRNLTEREMVSLCSDFLTSGTDSTVAVMQRTMAELVAHPEIQAKLRSEILTHMHNDDHHLMLPLPYLQAVVLKGLRQRHQPGLFSVPHAATEDGGARFEGFIVPHADCQLRAAPHGRMAMDETVWPDARRF